MRDAKPPAHVGMLGVVPYPAYVRARLLIMLALAAGCDSNDSAPSKGAAVSASSSATHRPRAYPAPQWQAIHDDTGRGPEQGGVVPITRTLIGKLTPVDRVGLAIRFEGGEKEAQLDWSATLGSAVFRVVRPGGKVVELELASVPAHTDRGPLERVHVMHLRGDGLVQFAGVTPWDEPPPHLFAAEGTYHLSLQGELELGERDVPFRTHEHTIEIAPPSRAWVPLANRVGIAGRFVGKVEGLDGMPNQIGSPIGDVAHNALVRFRVGGGQAVDIAISPKGALAGGRRFTLDEAEREGDPWKGLFDRPAK
jgi:hypothetical protein